YSKSNSLIVELARMSEPDRRHQPAVVGLVPVDGAAEGKEPVGVGIGAVARPFGKAHAGLAQAVKPEGGQVEMRAVAIAPGKEARIARIFVQEGVEKLRPHLVGALADRRTDNRHRVAPARAK